MNFTKIIIFTFILITTDYLETSAAVDSDVQYGYWTVNKHKNYLYHGFHQLYRKKTKLACAKICLKTKYCTGFSHVRNLGFCYVFLHTEADAEKNGNRFESLLHYRKRIVGCPRDIGYTLSDDEEVCLKIYTTKVNFDKAGRQCERDGGHLYLMDSIYRRDILIRYFTNQVNDEYFLGARRSGDGGVPQYRWLNGRAVEANMWNPNDRPNRWSECIVIRSFELPYVGASNCELSAMFVCQIS